MSVGVLQEVMPRDLPDVFDVDDAKEDDMEDMEIEVDDEEVQVEDDLLAEELPSSDDENLCVHEGWINLYNEDLKKKVLVHGLEGTAPEPRYLCRVNLVGCLKNGTEFACHEPLTLQLGDAEAVLGIDLVLLSMNVGEKCLVEISPALGFGSLGRVPDVPPNTVLIYLMELVSTTPERQLSCYSTQELRLTGIRKRERGNWWYDRKEYELALTCYRRALDYLEPQDRADEDNLLDDRLKVYNNMGSIYLKLKSYDVALEAIDQVVRCQPDNVKALFRKAKILAGQGLHKKALEVLSKAVELEPKNSAVHTELKVIQDVVKSDERQSQTLYRKMLGAEEDAGRGNVTRTSSPPQREPVPSDPVKPTEPSAKSSKLKKSGIANLHKPRSATSRTRWELFLLGTVAVAAAGAVAWRYRTHFT